MEHEEQEGIAYLGIDPGVSGGICIIYTQRGTPPTMIHGKCGATPHDMAWSISTPMDNLRDDYGITHWVAGIEKVHSFPGQGVASTFKFGMNYGTWVGILTSLPISYRMITPHTWMKHYGTMPKDKTDRKNYIKSLAQCIYPDSNRITLATSDAILIAHYTMQHDQGKKFV